MKEFLGKVNDFRESITVNKNGICRNRDGEIRFKYRQLNDIYKAVRDKIKDAPGLFIKIEDELLRDPTTIRSTVTLSDGENHVCGVGYAVLGELKNKDGKDSMGMPQQTGCAQTYARKYAFEALLLLDDDIDADSLTGESSSDQKAVQNTPSSPPHPSIPPSIKVDIAYQDIPSGDLKCPMCKKGKMFDNGHAIGCSNWNNPTDKCEFKSIFKNESPLCLDDMKDVLSGKNSRTLSFKQQDGTFRKSSLYLDGGQVKKGMPNRESEVKSTEEKGPEQKIFESPF